MRRRRTEAEAIGRWRDPGGSYEVRQASAEAWSDALWNRLEQMPSDAERSRLYTLQIDFNERRPGYPWNPYDGFKQASSTAWSRGAP